MNEDSLKKNTLMLYLLQASTYVFPLLTFPYLTRVLAPDTYGLMVSGNAVIAYFQAFVDFGFILSATRKCSLLRDDEEELRVEVSATIYAKIVLAALGFVVLGAAIALVPSWSSMAWYLFVSYLSVLATCFIPDFLFRGIEKMSTITYRTVAVRALFTVLVFAFVRTPDDFILVPIFNCVGNIIAAIWTISYASTVVQFKFVRVAFSKVLVVAKESSPYFASRIAATVYSSSNAIVLGLICPAAVVASYGVANTIISAVKNLAVPLSDSLFPHLVRTKKIDPAILILKRTMPLFIGAALLLFVFADQVVLLAAGAGYGDAAWCIRLMVPLILMSLPNYILGFPVLGALGKAKHANYSVIVSAVLYILGIGILCLLDLVSLNSCIALLCLTELSTLAYRVIVVAVFFHRK